MKAQRTCGPNLTKAECDACLKYLALALPRANMSVEDAEAMREMYFQLFVKHGVTYAMLKPVCEKIVIAPPPAGKAKFFPDPGALYEPCRQEALQRLADLAAYRRALNLLDGPQGEPETVSVPRRGAHSIGSGLPPVGDLAALQKFLGDVTPDEPRRSVQQDPEALSPEREAQLAAMRDSLARRMKGV